MSLIINVFFTVYSYQQLILDKISNIIIANIFFLKYIIIYALQYYFLIPCSVFVKLVNQSYIYLSDFELEEKIEGKELIAYALLDIGHLLSISFTRSTEKSNKLKIACQRD